MNEKYINLIDRELYKCVKYTGENYLDVYKLLGNKNIDDWSKKFIDIKIKGDVVNILPVSYITKNVSTNEIKIFNEDSFNTVFMEYPNASSNKLMVSTKYKNFSDITCPWCNSIVTGKEKRAKGIDVKITSLRCCFCKKMFIVKLSTKKLYIIMIDDTLNLYRKDFINIRNDYIILS